MEVQPGQQNIKEKQLKKSNKDQQNYYQKLKTYHIAIA